MSEDDVSIDLSLHTSLDAQPISAQQLSIDDTFDGQEDINDLREIAKQFEALKTLNGDEQQLAFIQLRSKQDKLIKENEHRKTRSTYQVMQYIRVFDVIEYFVATTPRMFVT
jgi:hypothetical protein